MTKDEKGAVCSEACDVYNLRVIFQCFAEYTVPMFTIFLLLFVAQVNQSAK